MRVDPGPRRCQSGLAGDSDMRCGHGLLFSSPADLPPLSKMKTEHVDKGYSRVWQKIGCGAYAPSVGARPKMCGKYATPAIAGVGGGKPARQKGSCSMVPGEPLVLPYFFCESMDKTQGSCGLSTDGRKHSLVFMLLVGGNFYRQIGLNPLRLWILTGNLCSNSGLDPLQIFFLTLRGCPFTLRLLPRQAFAACLS